MTDYDNTNRISLWLNDRIEKRTHPQLKGNGEIKVEYDYDHESREAIDPVWASAWFDKDMAPEDKKALMGIIQRHNQSSRRPFLSISLTPKEQQNTSQSFQDPDPGDDIPW